MVELLAHGIIVSFLIRFVIFLCTKWGVIEWFEETFGNLCYFCFCFWLAVLYVSFLSAFYYVLFGVIDYTVMTLPFFSTVLAVDLLKLID